MVVEADESDGSFTKLPSTNIIITNIDAEHLDHYGSFRNLKEAFKQFINNIPFYGMAIVFLITLLYKVFYLKLRIKELLLMALALRLIIKLKILKIIMEKLFTLEVSPRAHTPTKSINGIISNIPGIHNVQNVLAASAMAIEMGIKSEFIKTALENFKV